MPDRQVEADVMSNALSERGYGRFSRAEIKVTEIDFVTEVSRELRFGPEFLSVGRHVENVHSPL